MTGLDLDTPVRLTRAALKRVAERRLSIDQDEPLLEQLKRLFPAVVAGFAEWRGSYQPEVWIRWHWYFDDSVKRFVIPPHGITSNITLIADSSGVELSREEFARFILRRIRRRNDWQPWLQLATVRQHAAAQARAQRLSASAPLVVPAEHRDGTARWGKKTLRELADLPDHKQFGAIAKLAREKFGFPTTLAVVHSARDPSNLLYEHNHLREWREAYDREQLVLIDPRVTLITGPATWTARDRRAENPAFWDLANRHGVRSGWVMRSDDSTATLVLSRAEPDITSLDVASMEPNLIMLARAAHALMTRLLAQRGSDARRDNEGLPAQDVEIIAYLQKGKMRKEIAAFMNISIPTLDRRLRTIKEKLGVDTNQQAVDVAIQLGLLSMPD